MPSRGPTIRITVRITDAGSNLIFAFPGSEPLSVTGSLNRTRLIEQRAALREELERIRGDMSNAMASNSWVAISSAVHRLHVRGQRLSWQLFIQQCPEVQNLFCRTCPEWRSETNVLPLIEVEAPIADIVPVEFLPLFDLTPPPDIDAPHTLFAVARRFLGFSTLVKRIIPRTPLVPETVLENLPMLPLKFFHHAGLEGAQTEAAFFQANNHCVDLEGPWPDQVLNQAQVIDSVAEHVWNPALRFNGAVRQPLDQVQHFACHCETHETLSEDCFLGFAHDNRSHRKVTIGDLQNRFAALSVRLPRQEDVALPLIFLNACGTSAIDPGGVSSFPALFVEENGNRGFIGTETRMPDKFAAAFSQAFYTHLLEGYPLGEAIHAAKWNLLEKQNNPMGIFYTVYANPDTRVRKPAKVKTF